MYGLEPPSTPGCVACTDWNHLPREEVSATRADATEPAVRLTTRVSSARAARSRSATRSARAPRSRCVGRARGTPAGRDEAPRPHDKGRAHRQGRDRMVVERRSTLHPDVVTTRLLLHSLEHAGKFSVARSDVRRPTAVTRRHARSRPRPRRRRAPTDEWHSRSPDPRRTRSLAQPCGNNTHDTHTHATCAIERSRPRTCRRAARRA